MHSHESLSALGGELFPVLDVGAGPLAPAIGLRILGHTVRS